MRQTVIDLATENLAGRAAPDNEIALTLAELVEAYGCEAVLTALGNLGFAVAPNADHDLQLLRTYTAMLHEFTKDQDLVIHVVAHLCKLDIITGAPESLQSIASQFGQTKQNIHRLEQNIRHRLNLVA